MKNLKIGLIALIVGSSFLSIQAIELNVDRTPLGLTEKGLTCALKYDLAKDFKRKGLSEEQLKLPDIKIRKIASNLVYTRTKDSLFLYKTFGRRGVIRLGTDNGLYVSYYNNSDRNKVMLMKKLGKNERYTTPLTMYHLFIKPSKILEYRCTKANR